MIIEPVDLIKVLLFAFQFLLGWLVKALFERIGSLEKKDGELLEKIVGMAINLPNEYTKKTDFMKMGDDIFAALRRIEDKLEEKADRT